MTFDTGREVHPSNWNESVDSIGIGFTGRGGVLIGNTTSGKDIL